MKKEKASNKYQRIGIAIFRLLAERSLELIPIYGPYIKVGLEIINTVNSEIEKEQYLTRDRLVEALHSLSYTQVKNTVDEVLSSPKGKDAVLSLSLNEQKELRQRLINIPSEIDELLIEIKENDIQKAKAVKEAKENQLKKKVQKLHISLKKQLKSKKLDLAIITARQILKLSPHDKEAQKIETFLFKRVAYKIKHPTGRAVAIVHGGLYLIGIVLIFIFHLYGPTLGKLAILIFNLCFILSYKVVLHKRDLSTALLILGLSVVIGVCIVYNDR